MRILSVQSSAKGADSLTRSLSEKLIKQFQSTGKASSVIERDLAQGAQHIDGAWVGAAYTPDEHRTDEQKQLLATSDTLINELKDADLIVIGSPIYNFGVPASLKAWVDLVARVGVTFQYTEQGPQGLLSGKKAVIVTSSGGVPVGSPVDFNVPFLKQVLGFIGITDVEVVAAEGVAMDAEGAQRKAEEQIAALAA
ncbi:FMN-dependent NADH-azoreductase [Polycladidibacter stylochi]|uniref:FMN-dependent NADH-azoreductase n=1 Tax=Polycladidibacter stylochi TaxID=1807766 RepID=UPI0008317030|nr:NAD(P)H-dependent oxidoreductase [Pseudovibrio stylochi]